uniref:DUF4806 domain-containing protein n=1 Tax=Panagrellus redivivus TaxID=6233 RepID=A0A7E4W7B6_PANRE
MLAVPATSLAEMSRASSATSATDSRARSRHESASSPTTPTAVEAKSLTPLNVKVKSEPIEEDEATDTSSFADNFFANMMRHEDDSATSEASSSVSRKRPSMEGESSSTMKKVFRSPSPRQVPGPSSSVARFQPNPSLPGPSRPQVTTAASSSMKPPMMPLPQQRRKQQPPPLWDMIVRFPDELASNSDKFNAAMKSWMSTSIDDVQVPVIIRPNGMRIVPITIVQTKLYAQFALNVVSHMMKTTNPLHSYFLEPVEAWMYNVINSTLFNHSLGLKVFQSKEECLDIREVEFQYWHIKKYHLEQIFGIYSKDVPPETIKKRNVTGTLVRLKGDTYKAIKRIEERLKLLATPYKFPH